MHVWCGFGSPGEAPSRLAATMEAFYRIPFERFERYTPYGSPEDVAAALRPYVRAGCRSFNLITGDAGARDTIDGALTVRELLRG